MIRYMHISVSLFCMIAILHCTNALINVDSPNGFNEVFDYNPCKSKETCSDCITAHRECAWCYSDTGSSGEATYSRCDLKQNLIGKCNDKTHMEYVKAELKKLVNKELSDGGEKGNEDIVQLKPQHVHLKIGPNDPFDLEVKYQAANHPVDLYYLMDLSKSMKDDKDKLATLGGTLASEMGRITKDFRLGFGSFVDKPTLPYTAHTERIREKFCTGPGVTCEVPYSFKHHMSMTSDAKRFSTKVNEATVTGNLDAPEGGSDAIIQAIECKEQIGWRNESRKILLFSTDAGFHYGGDGKLGGIVVPNDGKCHLDRNGIYTEALTQDYPSISLINRKVKENKVSIIFAVTEDQYNIYKKLKSSIEGSSAGTLNKDSSNIVDLVKKEYGEISSSVELKNSNVENIRISYYSSCLGTREKETNICRNLKISDSVKFTVRIEVLDCPKDRRNWNQTVKIYPVGLRDELIVDIETICECNCEKPWNEERDSPRCTNGNGTYECGICACNPGRYGQFCQCDALTSKQTNDDSSLSQCRRNNETKICSGRGECKCGVCQCYQIEQNSEERYEGAFCECNNLACDKPNGVICSGNGKCSCGVCKCFSGWKGSSCNCPTSNHTCIQPGSKEVCSGKGECDCGECKCINTEEDHYDGKYCEECLTCLGAKCDAYKDCVECRAFGSGRLLEGSEDCGAECNATRIEEVDKAEVKGKQEQFCSSLDSNNCRFFFVYKREENGEPLILVQKTRACPKPLNVVALTSGVVGGILLIGIALLLIWKLLTTIHDRREYEKFVKESKQANWEAGDNPLYKPSTTTFSNPAFHGN